MNKRFFGYLEPLPGLYLGQYEVEIKSLTVEFGDGYVRTLAPATYSGAIYLYRTDAYFESIETLVEAPADGTRPIVRSITPPTFTIPAAISKEERRIPSILEQLVGLLPNQLIFDSTDATKVVLRYNQTPQIGAGGILTVGFAEFGVPRNPHLALAAPTEAVANRDGIVQFFVFPLKNDDFVSPTYQWTVRGGVIANDGDWRAAISLDLSDAFPGYSTNVIVSVVATEGPFRVEAETTIRARVLPANSDVGAGSPEARTPLRRRAVETASGD